MAGKITDRYRIEFNLGYNESGSVTLSAKGQGGVPGALERFAEVLTDGAALTITNIELIEGR